MFHAFTRMIRESARKFVVLDAAPTGHTLLLLDATGAYHRDVMRHATDEAKYTTPRMQLQKQERTRVIIVTLAETTPKPRRNHARAGSPAPARRPATRRNHPVSLGHQRQPGRRAPHRPPAAATRQRRNERHPAGAAHQSSTPVQHTSQGRTAIIAQQCQEPSNARNPSAQSNSWACCQGKGEPRPSGLDMRKPRAGRGSELFSGDAKALRCTPGWGSSTSPAAVSPAPRSGRPAAPRRSP